LHAAVLDAVANHDEDLAVAGAVLPIGVHEVGRLRVELFAHRAVALAGVAMATGALFVVLLFARRDRRRVYGHRIFDRSRRRMAMRAAFRVRRRMLMLLRMARGKRDRHGNGEREYQDGIANRGWHVSLSYGSVSIIREFWPRP